MNDNDRGYKKELDLCSTFCLCCGNYVKRYVKVDEVPCSLCWGKNNNMNKWEDPVNWSYQKSRYKRGFTKKVHVKRKCIRMWTHVPMQKMPKVKTNDDDDDAIGFMF